MPDDRVVCSQICRMHEVAPEDGVPQSGKKWPQYLAATAGKLFSDNDKI
jgi:hypothetical protein